MSLISTRSISLDSTFKAFFKRIEGIQKEVAEERGWVMRTSSRPSSRGSRAFRRKLLR
jgi:hypothetical protein